MMNESFFGPNRWDPFRDLGRFHTEMNRLFSDARDHRRDAPALNVWTGPEGAVITAALPGLAADSLDVSVLGQTLTLRGERQVEELGQEVTTHRRERSTGAWTRTVELPFRVEADKVEARYTRGVLRITAPRAEADKPRKITVKGN